MTIKGEIRSYGPEDMEMPVELFTKKLGEISMAVEDVIKNYAAEIERVGEIYKNLKEKQKPYKVMALNFSKHIHALHKAIRDEEMTNIKEGKLMEERKVLPIENFPKFGQWPEGLEWGGYVENLKYASQEIRAEITQAQGMANEFTDRERQQIVDGILENLINLNNGLEELRRIIKSEENEV